MAIIFITHDFGIVARMCDSVAVMYAGRVVERGDVRQLFNQSQPPVHEGADGLCAADGTHRPALRH